MKKFLITVLLLGVIAPAVRAETLTMSTYYPAPFGIYDRLRLVPRNTAPTCDASLEGLLYYDSITNAIYVCGLSGTWEPITGVWSHDKGLDKVFLTHNDIDGDGWPSYIGLGTDEPHAQLHLTGSAGEAGELFLENTGAGNRVGITFTLAGAWCRYKIDEYQDKLHFILYDIARDLDRVRLTLTPSGYLGIGTESPACLLEIKDPEEAVATHRFENTNGRSEVQFVKDDAVWGGVGAFGQTWVKPDLQNAVGLTSYLPDTGFLFFRTIKTTTHYLDKMAITYLGNVGIETFHPIARLDIRSGTTDLASEGLTPHGSFHISGRGPYLTFADTDAACPTDAWRMGGWNDHLLLATEENDCTNSTIDRFFMERGTGDVLIGDPLHEDPQTPDAQFHISENNATDAFRVDDELNDATPFIIVHGGNVGIGTTAPAGKLDVNGAINTTATNLPDYVFEDDYELESLEEHARSMWKNKHLKAIPKTRVDEQGREIIEHSEMDKGILEELEKAHIYIEQIDSRIDRLEERIKKHSQ